MGSCHKAQNNRVVQMACTGLVHAHQPAARSTHPSHGTSLMQELRDNMPAAHARLVHQRLLRRARHAASPSRARQSTAPYSKLGGCTVRHSAARGSGERPGTHSRSGAATPAAARGAWGTAPQKSTRTRNCGHTTPRKQKTLRKPRHPCRHMYVSTLCPVGVAAHERSHTSVSRRVHHEEIL